MNRRMVAILLVVLLCGVVDSETPPKILMEAPHTFDLDVDMGLLFFQNRGTLYAFELDSGRQRWQQSRRQDGLYLESVFGKRHLMMYSTDAVVVLDKATGRELVRLRQRGLGAIKYAGFMWNSDWVFCDFEKAEMLYPPGERRGYTLNLGEGFSGFGLMPDRTSIYLAYMKESAQSSQNEVASRQYTIFHGPPDSMDPAPKYVIETSAYLQILGATLSGELIASGRKGEARTLQVRHALTGELLREVAYPDEQGSLVLPGCTSDAAYAVFMDVQQKTPQLIDVHAGAATLTLQREGHKFQRYFHGDGIGQVWLLSTDEEHNVWLWPFEENARPRKVLDGRRFLPGQVGHIAPPFFFVWNNTDTNPFSILHLDTLEAVARYGKELRHADYYPGRHFSNDMARIMTASYHRESDSDLGSYRTQVYGANPQGRLLDMAQQGRAFSPDGRYVLLQAEAPSYDGKQDYAEWRARYDSADKTITLLEVDTKATLLQLPSDGFQSTSAFSGDGKRFAVHNRPAVTVVDMEAGNRLIQLDYPAGNAYFTSFCFSSDSAVLLAAARGRALLFDAATGALLHTVTESERFMHRYQPVSDQDFIQKVEYRARDFVATFTDRFKPTATLEIAFCNDGNNFITIAEGQILRVWNTATGSLARVINPKMPETRNEYGYIENKIVLSGKGDYALAFNANGLSDGSLWDVNTGKLIRRYSFKDTGRQVKAAVSDDGRTVYAVLGGNLHYLSGREDDEP